MEQVLWLLLGFRTEALVSLPRFWKGREVGWHHREWGDIQGPHSALNQTCCPANLLVPSVACLFGTHTLFSGNSP